MQKQLVIYGSGGHTVPFLDYIAKATGRVKPELCFIPTASGDDEAYIASFYSVCFQLHVTPHVLKVWINTYNQTESFEETISQMDAIIVGGGNTLNMLAIWKAQGIDKALKKAYDGGVVMGGGSAGSLCWFNGGTTDSRPKELSIVKGMKFIDKSHCPHYNSEQYRRPFYHTNIKSGRLSNGYACDDRSGIHFLDGNVNTAITLDLENHSYEVQLKDGSIVEERLENILIS